MHAHRGQAFQGVTPSFHLSNYQLSKQRYFVVCPLTSYRQRTSRTDPKILSGFAFTLGVGNQSRDELQDVRFAVDVRERIVVHRLFEVDGVEDAHVVPGGDQHLAALHDKGSLRISYYEGGALGLGALHDVGLYEESRFAAAGAADDEHVFICQE